MNLLSDSTIDKSDVPVFIWYGYYVSLFFDKDCDFYALLSNHSNKAFNG